jgi:hypothetical protein
MKSLTTAFAISSFVATLGATSMMPMVANADPVERSYVACNQYGDCWRVHERYAYGSKVPITYYNSDWYAAHQNDEHIHWRSDPDNDRGYYDRDGSWHADPGARALAGGATGAGIGAAALPARRLAPPSGVARAPSPARPPHRITDQNLAPITALALIGQGTELLEKARIRPGLPF